MKFRRQVHAEDSVNLTPLIDVVFLLLIFFMVSTTFTKETHLAIDLPEATGSPSTEVDGTIDILIAADGTYSVNGRALVNTTPEILSAALADVAGSEREQPLIITADAKTPHQSVVTAMDVVGQLGFARISIATRHPEPETP